MIPNQTLKIIDLTQKTIIPENHNYEVGQVPETSNCDNISTDILFSEHVELIEDLLNSSDISKSLEISSQVTNENSKNEQPNPELIIDGIISQNIDKQLKPLVLLPTSLKGIENTTLAQSTNKASLIPSEITGINKVGNISGLGQITDITKSILSATIVKNQTTALPSINNKINNTNILEQATDITKRIQSSNTNKNQLTQQGELTDQKKITIKNSGESSIATNKGSNEGELLNSNIKNLNGTQRQINLNLKPGQNISDISEISKLRENRQSTINQQEIEKTPSSVNLATKAESRINPILSQFAQNSSVKKKELAQIKNNENADKVVKSVEKTHLKAQRNPLSQSHPVKGLNKLTDNQPLRADNVVIVSDRSTKHPQVNTEAKPNVSISFKNETQNLNQSLSNGLSENDLANLSQKSNPQKDILQQLNPIIRSISHPQSLDVKGGSSLFANQATRPNNIYTEVINKISDWIQQASQTTKDQTQISIQGGKIGQLNIRFNQDQISNHVTIFVGTELAKIEIQKVVPQINENLIQKDIELDHLEVLVDSSNQEKSQNENHLHKSNNTNLGSSMHEHTNNETQRVQIRNYGYNTIEVLA